MALPTRPETKSKWKPRGYKEQSLWIYGRRKDLSTGEIKGWPQTQHSSPRTAGWPCRGRVAQYKPQASVSRSNDSAGGLGSGALVWLRFCFSSKSLREP